jgi:hypothetical protein
MNSTFDCSKIEHLMLKLSGEILAGSKGFGFDDAVCDALTDDLIEVREKGYGLAIVLGGEISSAAAASKTWSSIGLPWTTSECLPPSKTPFTSAKS